MKRFSLIAAILAGIVGLCWFFPLFHVVSLEEAEKARAAAAFDPAAFADKFWKENLMKSLDRAVNADVLLPAIARDPADARKRFARSLGVSESYTYFISGQGRVVSANEDEIGLAVSEGAALPEISLQVGLLFSSAVRDGTGLIDVNDYPNSQDFNGISEALNRIVEDQVLPNLRERAKVGTVIQFVGCAEVNDESTDLKPLKMVPVEFKAVQAPTSKHQ